MKTLKIKIKTASFWSVVLASGAVYCATLAPTVFWIDSAIYLTAIKEFGVTYAPGFPIYIIIAKLWSFLPIFWLNFTQKINLLSAVFASFSCGFLYLSIAKLIENRFSFLKKNEGENDTEKQDFAPLSWQNLTAISTALLFGFSYSFWYQATYAETYSLHIFFLSLVVYSSILIAGENFAENNLSTREKKYFLLFAVSWGLSFANHPMTVELLPAIAWFLWKVKNTIRINRRFFIILAVIFFLSGFLPYVYIPISSAQNPEMDWGNPENLTNFFNHVTGRHWTADSKNFVFLDDKFLGNIKNALLLFYRQFFTVGLVFLGVGIFYLFKKNVKLLLFLSLIIATSFFFTVSYTTTEYASWLVPAHFAIAILISAGIYFTVKVIHSKQKTDQKNGHIFILVLLFLCIIFGLKSNWLSLDRHANFYPEDVGHNILKNVEDGSLVISEAGMAMSSIIFNKTVLDNKPNVIAIHRDSIWSPWVRQNLKKYEARGLVLPDMDIDPKLLDDMRVRSDFNMQYLDALVRGNIDKINIYSVMPDTFEGIGIIPWGFVYKYTTKNENPPPDAWNFEFQNTQFCELVFPSFSNPSFRRCKHYGMEPGDGLNFTQPEEFLAPGNADFNETKAGYAMAYKNLGDMHLYAGNYDFAVPSYTRAINLLTDNYTPEQKKYFYLQKGVALMNAGRTEESIRFATESFAMFPQTREMFWLLAANYNKTGQADKAMNTLISALQMYPDDQNLNILFSKISGKQNTVSPFPQ